MRIAENAELDLWVGSLLGKILEIDPVFVILSAQHVRADVFPARLDGGSAEGRIGGRQEEYLFIGLREHRYKVAECGDDAVGEAELLFRRRPAVHPITPAEEGGREAVVGDIGVAENAVLHATVERLQNAGRRGKIHIGDPHTDHLIVRAGEFRGLRVLVKDGAAAFVHADRLRVAPVDAFVKIDGHGGSFLYGSILFSL